ncbi:LPXTG cell wall anchor domain-containing protein [Candidatus Saccharibacteria bacterium]|nr:MAG: LPXTG cell wall anchor domain-containing protein [Candidatus Saccharibacteria bacterium]
MSETGNTGTAVLGASTTVASTVALAKTGAPLVMSIAVGATLITLTLTVFLSRRKSN